MEEDGGVQILDKLGLLNHAIEKVTAGTSSRPFKVWNNSWSKLIAVPAKPLGDLSMARLRIPELA